MILIGIDTGAKGLFQGGDGIIREKKLMAS